MKKTWIKARLTRLNLIAAGALLSIPVTAFAMYDYYADISRYVSVGSNLSGSFSSNSSYGVLLVGTYNGLNSSSSSGGRAGRSRISA